MGEQGKWSCSRISFQRLNKTTSRSWIIQATKLFKITFRIYSEIWLFVIVLLLFMIVSQPPHVVLLISHLWWMDLKWYFFSFCVQCSVFSNLNSINYHIFSTFMDEKSASGWKEHACWYVGYGDHGHFLSQQKIERTN